MVQCVYDALLVPAATDRWADWDASRSAGWDEPL